MSIYTAIRWCDDDDPPEVMLFEDIGFATDWVLNPFDYSDEYLSTLRQQLLCFKTVQFGRHMRGCILNLTVVPK